MAIALVCEAREGYISADTGHPSIGFTVIYTGADVAGSFLKALVVVDVNGIVTLPGFASAIAAATRNYPVVQSLGFTVSANNVLLPQYQLG